MPHSRNQGAPRYSAADVKTLATSLIEQHQLKTVAHKVLATQIARALMAGRLAEATRAIALLPPPPARVDVSEQTVSAAQARAKLTEIVMNAAAAYQMEEGHSESAEVAALKAQVESLQDECKHLRGTKPRQLPPPSDKPVTSGASASTAPTSAPPSLPEAARPSCWDDTANGRAWHAWRNAGGYDRGGTYGPSPWDDGLSAQGWINRLNRREW
jgi:hypothetical protein